MDLGTDEFHDRVEVGRGSFGVVYRASQPSLRRTVAIKVLRATDEATRRRFDRERQALGLVSRHPHVAQVFASGFTPLGAPYLAMEWLENGSLAVPVLARTMNDPVPDLRPVGVPDPVCRAVERAMAKDPGHRHTSVEEFGRDLQAAQRRLGVPVTEMVLPVERTGSAAPRDEAPVEMPPSPVSTGPGSRRPRLLAAAVGAVVILAGVVAIFLLRGAGDRLGPVPPSPGHRRRRRRHQPRAPPRRHPPPHPHPGAPRVTWERATGRCLNAPSPAVEGEWQVSAAREVLAGRPYSWDCGTSSARRVRATTSPRSCWRPTARRPPQTPLLRRTNGPTSSIPTSSPARPRSTPPHVHRRLERDQPGLLGVRRFRGRGMKARRRRR